MANNPTTTGKRGQREAARITGIFALGMHACMKTNLIIEGEMLNIIDHHQNYINIYLRDKCKFTESTQEAGGRATRKIFGLHHGSVWR